MDLNRVRWSFIIALFLSAFAATIIVPKEALAVYNTKILDKNAIARLSDQQLIDYYIDVMVELEVTKSTGIFGPDL